MLVQALSNKHTAYLQSLFQLLHDNYLVNYALKWNCSVSQYLFVTKALLIMIERCVVEFLPKAHEFR